MTNFFFIKIKYKIQIYIKDKTYLTLFTNIYHIFKYILKIKTYLSKSNTKLGTKVFEY